jgi:hypothetical protein
MTIRRRITTTIDEIDDSEDSQSPTNLPMPNIGSPASDLHAETLTDFPDSSDEKSETHPSHDGPFRPTTIGRTFADLAVEFKNDYRAMAILLTIVSVIIFVAKIDSIESFKYPLITATILNMIWFGSPVVAALLRRLKKR